MRKAKCALWLLLILMVPDRGAAQSADMPSAVGRISYGETLAPGAAIADSSGKSSRTHGLNLACSRVRRPEAGSRRQMLARPSMSAHTDTMPGVGSHPHSHSSVSPCGRAPRSLVVGGITTRVSLSFTQWPRRGVLG